MTKETDNKSKRELEAQESVKACYPRIEEERGECGLIISETKNFQHYLLDSLTWSSAVTLAKASCVD
jgi:hypothetical protein